MKFDLRKQDKSIIKVIGVGGGGGNAVGYMYQQGIVGVDFVICNTDEQAMNNSTVPTKIVLGPNLTDGRGAGSRPEVGKEACIESIDEVRSFLNDGTRMLFITAGMGGGTGTGAAPIIAKAAKEMGILTVGIVTLPFSFEGMRRKRQSLEGLDNLKKNVDAILVISNDKLREMHGDLALSAAFSNADNVLSTAAKAIAEIITVPGYINVDFEDVNYVMKESGVALMGIGIAEGEDRARKAIHMALNSPLLEENDIRGAKHILLNISSGKKEVTMDEIGEITDHVQEEAGYGTDLIWGNCYDEALGDKISITLISTGFESSANRTKKVVEPEVTKVSLEDDFEIVTDTNDFGFIEPKPGKSKSVDFDTDDIKKTIDAFGVKTYPDRGSEDKVYADRSKFIEMENTRREFSRKTFTVPLDSQEAIENAEKIPAFKRRGFSLDDEDNGPKVVANNHHGHTTYIDKEGTIVQTGNSYLREISD